MHQANTAFVFPAANSAPAEPPAATGNVIAFPGAASVVPVVPKPEGLQWAEHYAGKGYDPVCISHREETAAYGDGAGKRPANNGGGTFPSWRTSTLAEETPFWLTGTNRGTGLRMSQRKSLAIDVDATDPAAVSALEKLVREALAGTPFRYGKKGFVALSRLAMTAGNIELPTKGTDLVFRSQLDPARPEFKVQLIMNGQIVAQGIHPQTGQPYRWDGELPPVSQLPVIDWDTLVTKIIEALALVGYVLKPREEDANDYAPLPPAAELMGTEKMLLVEKGRKLAKAKARKIMEPGATGRDTHVFAAAGYWRALIESGIVTDVEALKELDSVTELKGAPHYEQQVTHGLNKGNGIAAMYLREMRGAGSNTSANPAGYGSSVPTVAAVPTAHDFAGAAPPRSPMAQAAQSVATSIPAVAVLPWAAPHVPNAATTQTEAQPIADFVFPAAGPAAPNFSTPITVAGAVPTAAYPTGLHVPADMKAEYRSRLLLRLAELARGVRVDAGKIEIASRFLPAVRSGHLQMNDVLAPLGKVNDDAFRAALETINPVLLPNSEARWIAWGLVFPLAVEIERQISAIGEKGRGAAVKRAELATKIALFRPATDLLPVEATTAALDWLREPAPKALGGFWTDFPEMVRKQLQADPGNPAQGWATAVAQVHQAVKASGHQADWIVNNSGKIAASNTNNILMLANSAGIHNTYHDAFFDRPVITYADGNFRVDWSYNRVATELAVLARSELANREHFDPNVQKIEDVLFTNAMRNAVDSAVTRLGDFTVNPLKSNRLDVWLPEYLGYPVTHPLYGYVSRCGRVMLQGLASRILYPGCTLDEVVILIGTQGNRKTSLFRALADTFFADAFTSDVAPDADPKVLIEQTQGKLVAELAELLGLGKRDVNKVKNTLSKRSDTARKAYGRESVTIKRRFIFVGTSNLQNPPEFDGDYEKFADAIDAAHVNLLADDTGNRRFLPIKVRVPLINLDELTYEFPSLIAEAREAAKEDGPQCRGLMNLRRETAAMAEQADHQAQYLRKPACFDELSDKVAPLMEEGGRLTTVAIRELLGNRAPHDGKELGRALRDTGATPEHTRKGNVWKWPGPNAEHFYMVDKGKLMGMPAATFAANTSGFTAPPAAH
ncbi:VapE domain-containing protein [Bradyrhizobium manausense]|uniref:Virulence-associated protein E-like domain-containing protein n=1 Tax=Bradyrhizobium manausense TaxID=989370 RepID=A0A0R3D7E2_9BRAD|nr:VapE domain-containing protein [Bradyrhizobium manausense]KRQ03269.1 hypothetical protein AOQ71_31570 [Bradyrhizobium manausense]